MECHFSQARNQNVLYIGKYILYRYDSIVHSTINSDGIDEIIMLQ